LLKLSATEPGVIVSGVAHGAILLAAIIGFSDAKQFDPVQETLPVEVLTDQQFNEIVQGEKTAPAAKPQPPRADKVADIPEPKPTPPKQEAKVDVPTPPPSLRRIEEPDDADEPDEPKPAPTPPQRVAALPPPRPQPEPPKPVARPPDPPKAEAIEPPKPPERPKPEAKAPTPPTPPKAEEKPKVDQLAKLLEAKKIEDAKAAEAKKAADAKAAAAAKAKAAEQANEKSKFDAGAIAQALSRDSAQQRPATGRTVNQVAALGSPTANAPRMSPSMWGQLDGYMQDQYKQCWTYLGLTTGQKYVPQIRVQFNQSGGLVGQPELLNRPSDPNLRSLAESALRAVKKCDPLRIPAQYAPYYNEWKARILRFDPEEMAG
jgi:colicin import membrane protein